MRVKAKNLLLNKYISENVANTMRKPMVKAKGCLKTTMKASIKLFLSEASRRIFIKKEKINRNTRDGAVVQRKPSNLDNCFAVNAYPFLKADTVKPTAFIKESLIFCILLPP
jgi:hypothetical protein